MSEFSADDQIEEIRKEYLHVLVERLDDVESLILTMNSSSTKNEYLGEVFRLVHSLKGGASSCSMNQLSTVLHRFEDLLGQKHESLKIDEFADSCMDYIDLLRHCAESVSISGGETPENYASYASTLGMSQEQHGVVLLIESNRALLELEQQVLRESGYDFCVCTNGVEAINRILTDDFDAVISSQNIEGLDGSSIISALKVMDSKNKNVPTVLISSDRKAEQKCVPSLRPDHFLLKDSTFVSKLINVVKGLGKASQHDRNVSPISKLLYIEDDIILQKILKAAVRKYSDTEVRVADDKESALKMLIDYHPEIILLDNYLKDSKGEDMLGELARLETTRRTPVIFLTACPEEINIEELRQKGNIKGVIAKPFDARHLLQDISKMISAARCLGGPAVRRTWICRPMKTMRSGGGPDEHRRRLH